MVLCEGKEVILRHGELGRLRGFGTLLRPACDPVEGGYEKCGLWSRPPGLLAQVAETATREVGEEE